MAIDGEAVSVTDGYLKQSVVWHLGKTVQLGGGLTAPQYLTDEVRQRLPAACAGPFLQVDGWLTATPTP